MVYTTRSIGLVSRRLAVPLNLHAVIPAYNVATRLNDVLSKSTEYLPHDRIWVVDDGSRDGTSDVARSAGVRLIRHGTNRGKGAALKSGFRACLAAGAEAAVTLDGDGQHDPAFIPGFVQRLSDPVCDLVVGLRDLKWPGMPPDRVFSNRVSSMIASMAAGRGIRDSQCGYRLYRSEVLNRIHPVTDRYEMESEMLILAARNGFRIGWCPVRTVYNGQTSHIRRLRDTVRFLRVIGRFL
jgi:glycosyltransferase involved in cell wall biosynthesis